MIVVDEGVAAVMGCGCLVGAGLKPAPTGWWLERGMFVADEGVAAVRGWWWFRGPLAAPGPHPNPLPSNGRGGCLWRMRVLR